MENSDKKHILIRELYEYFIKQNYRIISAVGINETPIPRPLINNGYGDQEDKSPEILAYDTREKCYIIGVTRTNKHNLASEESLTEYNVFLDQEDPGTNTPFRLIVNMPSSLTNEFSALIREYIHREYWYKIVVMGSVRIVE